MFWMAVRRCVSWMEVEGFLVFGFVVRVSDFEYRHDPLDYVQRNRNKKVIYRSFVTNSWTNLAVGSSLIL
jgi:hypothetical protein